MTDRLSDKVLIVGAGPAGLSAAAALARAGQASLTIDLMARPGGMIHCQPLEDARPTHLPHDVAARWQRISTEFAAGGKRCMFQPETGFAGFDAAGRVLLTGRLGGLVTPKALILATGAREIVRPRPGWTLPGVRTAGSIQIALKTTGMAPSRRILLAGSGPILFAIAAQLATAGAPPVAVVQAGRVFSHPLAGLALPWEYLAEAAGYLATLVRHRVPILRGAELVSIGTDRGAFLAEIIHSNGQRRSIEAEMVGLHDGLASNEPGLPGNAPFPVLRVGDCRETLDACRPGRWNRGRRQDGGAPEGHGPARRARACRQRAPGAAHAGPHLRQ